MATKDNDVILCGNEKLMKEKAIDFTPTSELGTVMYIAKNNQFVGTIIIEDELKDETITVIQSLNNMKAKTIMLTGDNEEIAKKVATQVGLTSYKASLLPQNKVAEVERLLSEKKNR